MAINSSSKEAKFFCQCCGNEVPRKSKFCPSCGKFFASVLCPNCGHTGKTDDFRNGCPECGYAVDGSGNSVRNGTGAGTSGKSGKGKKSGKFSGKKRFFAPKKSSEAAFSGKNKYRSDSSLPVWIYAFSLLVLAALVILLYSCL